MTTFRKQDRLTKTLPGRLHEMWAGGNDPAVPAAAVFVAALLISLSSVWPVWADEAQKTAYINSLSYNLNTLLSVSLETKSMPANVDPFTRQALGDAIVICEKHIVTAGDNKTTVENALLNPNQGVIYPGALVKLDEDLAEGRPTPYVFDRAPLTIKVGLPNGQELTTVTVDSPSTDTVTNAIEKAVQQWLDSNSGYAPQIRAFGSATKAYSKEQVGVDLGFGAQWGENRATANLNLESTSESTTTVKAFTQIYYTVTIKEPLTAGAFFANSAPALSAANMPADHPPGYVRSVDYGRLLILVMTTNSAETKVNAEAALDYAATPDTKINAELKAKYDSILENSRITVLAIGGAAADATPLFNGSAAELAKNFDKVVVTGLVFNEANTGLPVSYIVADLQSRRTAQMKTTTKYVEEDCRQYASGFIKLFHDGLFVARYVVTWNQYNDTGNLQKMTYTSGLRDHNWMYTLELPGDAQTIRIDTYAESCGSKPAGTYMLAGVTRNCYKIWGSSCFPVSAELDETCTNRVEKGTATGH